jgi:hypothetical protein
LKTHLLIMFFVFYILWCFDMLGPDSCQS